MSLCNLGRPPQDAGLQNLVVNDTLRVNHLMKANKAEVERLCSVVNVTPSVTLVGSFSIVTEPGAGFSTHVFPSGPTNGGFSDPANVVTTFWTDKELIINDFRAVASGVSTDNLLTLNVRLVSAPTLSELNAPTPNGTERITITLPGILTPVSGIASVVPVSIPAGSYVSIRLDTVQSVLSVKASWSVRFERVE